MAGREERRMTPPRSAGACVNIGTVFDELLRNANLAFHFVKIWYRQGRQKVQWRRTSLIRSLYIDVMR
jgi:hypothetical protein